MIALTEASVWSFIKNSVASVLGRRRSINVKNQDYSSEDKIDHAAAVSRRLTPKPLASTRKLGYKPPPH